MEQAKEGKKCPKCGEVKPRSEFYVRRRAYAWAGVVLSLLTPCKECKKKGLRERYKKRRPEVPEGHKWCGRCRTWHPRTAFSPDRARPDGLQVYCRDSLGRYQRGRERLWRGAAGIEERRRWDQKLRSKASYYVSLAVFFGDMRPSPCAVCGEKDVQAHHFDYQQPLKVTWLCRKHHAEIHGHATGHMTSRVFAVNQPGSPRKEEGI